MKETLSDRAAVPGGLPPEIEANLSAVDRQRVRRCVSVMAVLGLASLIGTAWSLYLVNHFPLLLIALSPGGHYLILVAPTVDPLAFIAVGVTRRLVFYIASFHLGRALGPAGTHWLEDRAPRAGRLVRWLEQLFARASHIVVFLFPGPTLSTIAGCSKMRTRTFFSLTTPGLIFRMVVILGVTEWLRPYLELALAWIDEYWIPGTVALVAWMVAHQIYKQRRRG